MMISFWENTFWAKTSLSFVFGVPNSMHPEVFRCADWNGTRFKAVWPLVSEKTHFGLKYHFPLYLEGQTLHTLRFSGMPIVMVQVSKLFNDPVSEKTHFGLKHHSLLYLEGQTQYTLRLSGVLIAMVQSFKPVWWSVSEETHFGLKHHFPLYLEGHTLHTLRFSGMLNAQWYKVQSCMMICFWENTFLRLKDHFTLY